MNNLFCCNNNCFDKLRFYEIWKFMDIVSDIDRIASKYGLEVIASEQTCIKCNNTCNISYDKGNNDIYVQYYFDKEKYDESVHYEIRYHKNNKKIYVEFHIENKDKDNDPFIIKIKADLEKVPRSEYRFRNKRSKDTPTEFDINDLTGIKDAFKKLVRKVESVKQMIAIAEMVNKTRRKHVAKIFSKYRKQLYQLRYRKKLLGN